MKKGRQNIPEVQTCQIHLRMTTKSSLCDLYGDPGRCE
jgi:hypothetical protein